MISQACVILSVHGGGVCFWVWGCVLLGLGRAHNPLDTHPGHTPLDTALNTHIPWTHAPPGHTYPRILPDTHPQTHISPGHTHPSETHNLLPGTHTAPGPTPHPLWTQRSTGGWYASYWIAFLYHKYYALCFIRNQVNVCLILCAQFSRLEKF